MARVVGRRRSLAQVEFSTMRRKTKSFVTVVQTVDFVDATKSYHHVLETIRYMIVLTDLRQVDLRRQNLGLVALWEADADHPTP
jgi:hypothetical protein